MTDISETILFLVADSCLVAVGVEALKKVCGELVEEDGKKRWKNTLSKSIILSFALLLSVGSVVITYLGDVLVGEKIIMILYSAIVFACQWFIDMQVVKRLVDKLIERVLNRV